MIHKPVIILGSGGHSRVCLEILKMHNHEILGVVTPELTNGLKGIPLLGNDEVVLSYSPNDITLVNGIGSTGNPIIRKMIFDDFKKKGYHFLTLIHPAAIISSDAIISEGVQVMAGAIIQTGCIIGKNTIINTKVSVDHDCILGENVHLAPGVTLSGGVRVGDDTHIGTGVSIIQNIQIGKECVVGAGAVVIRNVNYKTTVIGIPAKEID